MFDAVHSEGSCPEGVGGRQSLADPERLSMNQAPMPGSKKAAVPEGVHSPGDLHDMLDFRPASWTLG
eukprot:7217689-Alexandrium_andersonii.AAC.1